jgi:hypothetical protein
MQQRSERPHLVLAGDIVTPMFAKERLTETLRIARGHFANVLYLPGNHEYEGLLNYKSHGDQRQKMEKQNEVLRTICEQNAARWLHRNVATLDNGEITVVGTTLWHRGNERAVQFHEDDVHWLRTVLKHPTTNKIVAATHHMPFNERLWKMHQHHDGNTFSFGQSKSFSTDMTSVMQEKKICGWIFGHSHFGTDFTDPVSGIHFRSNPVPFYGDPTIRHRDNLERYLAAMK